MDGNGMPIRGDTTAYIIVMYAVVILTCSHWGTVNIEVDQHSTYWW